MTNLLGDACHESIAALRQRKDHGIINSIPELPNADDEYTPAQRRAIDARLAEARKGPYYGPFKTADEAVAFLHREVRSRKAAKHKTN